jgi:hypothetical protein
MPERYAASTSLDDFPHYCVIAISVLVKADDSEALDVVPHAGQSDRVIHNMDI